MDDPVKTIRAAMHGDIPALYALYSHIGKKDDGYFEHVLGQGTAIYLCYDGAAMAGFCLLNGTPRYSLYRRLNIPEIQDINVLPDYRRRGHASALIAHCENVARAKGCDSVGISVGLTKDYGAAQILYSKLGYLPDGNGVTYDRAPVQARRMYPLDDDLALMMMKDLG